MGNTRDEFTEETKRKLGERVNLVCSNPDCGAPTKGPHTEGGKASNVGVAAHILGAAPNGARYDENQTSEQRKAFENGIWLCRICDKKVDGDEAKYPPELLRAWKLMAERAADQQLGKPRPPAVAPPTDDLGNLRLLLHELEHVRDQSKADAAGWSSTGEPPRKYDYKPIGVAVERVPMVLSDTNFAGHLKSLRESIEEMGGRGRSILGAQYPNLLKNVSNYADHTHTALTTLIKRVQAPAAPVAVVQVAPSVPEPVARTRNLKIAVNSEPVPNAPPEPDAVRHRMVISATNTSNVRIQDWLIDVEFPARLLVPAFPYENMVKERTTTDRAFFRFNMSHHALYPGDTQSVNIIYRIEQWIRSQPRCIPALFVTSHVNGIRDSGGGGTVPELPGVLWKVK